MGVDTTAGLVGALDVPKTGMPAIREVFPYGGQDPARWIILGDRYMVRMMALEDMRVSGVYVPDMGEDQRGWAAGRVVNLGGQEIGGVRKAHRLEADVWVPMFFNVGDVIVFERLTGKTFYMGGYEYRELSQCDVLAKAYDGA